MPHSLKHHFKLAAPQFNGVSFATLEKTTSAQIKFKSNAIMFDDQVLRFNSSVLVPAKQVYEVLQDAARQVIAYLRAERQCRYLSFFEPLIVGDGAILNSYVFSAYLLFALQEYYTLEYKINCFVAGKKYNITFKPESDETYYDEVLDPVFSGLLAFTTKEYSKNNIVHQFNAILIDLARSQSVQAVTLYLRVDGQMYYFFHYLLRYQNDFWNLNFDRPINYADPAFIKRLTPNQACDYVFYAFMNNNLGQYYKNIQYNMSSIYRIIQYTEGIKTARQLIQFDSLFINLQANYLLQEMFTYFVFRKYPIISSIAISQAQLSRTVKVALIACHSLTQLQSAYYPRSIKTIVVMEQVSSVLFYNVAHMLEPHVINCAPELQSKKRAAYEEKPKEDPSILAIAKLAELQYSYAKMYSNFQMETYKNQLKLAEIYAQNQQFAETMRLYFQQYQEREKSKYEEEKQTQKKKAAIAMQYYKEIAKTYATILELRHAKHDLELRAQALREKNYHVIAALQNPYLQHAFSCYQALSTRLQALQHENTEMGQMLESKTSFLENLYAQSAMQGKAIVDGLTAEQNELINAETNYNRYNLEAKWSSWFEYQVKKLEYIYNLEFG